MSNSLLSKKILVSILEHKIIFFWALVELHKTPTLSLVSMPLRIVSSDTNVFRLRIKYPPPARAWSSACTCSTGGTVRRTVRGEMPPPGAGQSPQRYLWPGPGATVLRHDCDPACSCMAPCHSDAGGSRPVGGKERTDIRIRITFTCPVCQLKQFSSMSVGTDSTTVLTSDLIPRKRAFSHKTKLCDKSLQGNVKLNRLRKHQQLPMQLWLHYEIHTVFR